MSNTGDPRPKNIRSRTTVTGSPSIANSRGPTPAGGAALLILTLETSKDNYWTLEGC